MSDCLRRRRASIRPWRALFDLRHMVDPCRDPGLRAAQLVDRARWNQFSAKIAVFQPAPVAGPHLRRPPQYHDTGTPQANLPTPSASSRPTWRPWTRGCRHQTCRSTCRSATIATTAPSGSNSSSTTGRCLTKIAEATIDGGRRRPGWPRRCRCSASANSASSRAAGSRRKVRRLSNWARNSAYPRSACANRDSCHGETAQRPHRKRPGHGRTQLKPLVATPAGCRLNYRR